MIEHITTKDFGDCQRLFHGRGHFYEGLSHINVDWLEPVIFITLYKACDQAWLMQQAQALYDLISQCRSVQVQYRYEKLAPTHVLMGDDIARTQVKESGLLFHIEFGKVQNTGLFLDMKNGRKWVKEHAENKNILNLFSYTCPFSVAAISGGAKQVVNVDISKSSLAKGRDNHRLNNHDTSKVVFAGVDIFKSNSRIRKYGPYDLIISDPPTLQFGSVNIQRDYAKIMRKIPVWLKPGGYIVLCLNSPDLTEQFLQDEMQTHCPECQFEQMIAPPEVFKEAHQGKGLKTLVYRYLPA